MAYVDGYLLPVPVKKLAAYLKLEQKASKIWREHGALEYRACVGEDLNSEWGIPFTKLAKVKEGETVIFAWIVFKSRAHRDRVNAKVMQDKRFSEGTKDAEMPFDCKRVAYGGFKVFVAPK